MKNLRYEQIWVCLLQEYRQFAFCSGHDANVVTMSNSTKTEVFHQGFLFYGLCNPVFVVAVFTYCYILQVNYLC